jgi:hypothetical protein
MNHWWQWLLKSENESTLNAITTLSTALSAFTALLAISITALVTLRQINRERKEKRPNLLVTDSFWTADGFKFEFTNLGPSPIFLAGIVHDRYGGNYQYENPKLLIQPNTTEPYEMKTGYVLSSVEGEFRLIFQYGLTGVVYHRLAFPYTIQTKLDKDTGKLTQNLDIPLWKQKLTAAIGSDHKVLQNNLLAKSVFRRRKWLWRLRR